MADAIDSKSIVRKGVWVRLPPPAHKQRPGTTPGFCLFLTAYSTSSVGRSQFDDEGLAAMLMRRAIGDGVSALLPLSALRYNRSVPSHSNG